MFRLLGILMSPILCTGSVRTFASLPKTEITAIAVTGSGAIYVTGSITSANLPVTPGAFQRDYHAVICPDWQFAYPCSDGFAAKFDASGHLVYATYLGGTGNDVPQSIAVDANGNAYIAGYTSSNDFPQTANHFADSSPQRAFVTKLNPSGTGLVFSTVLPGVTGASAIAVDALGQAHIGGAANQDGTVNSAANPAKRGSVITFWATGLGSMESPVPDGSIASADRLSNTAITPTVSFFGWPADVLYSGSAPGMVAGVVQINARVPEQMGPFSYPVDLVLSSRGIYMPNRVTVNVQ